MDFRAVPPTPSKHINPAAVAYFESNVYEVGDLQKNEQNIKMTIHFIGGTKLDLTGSEAFGFLKEFLHPKFP